MKFDETVSSRYDVERLIEKQWVNHTDIMDCFVNISNDLLSNLEEIIENMRDEIERLEEENDNLQDAIADLKYDNNELENEIERLNNQLDNEYK